MANQLGGRTAGRCPGTDLSAGGQPRRPPRQCAIVDGDHAFHLRVDQTPQVLAQRFAAQSRRPNFGNNALPRLNMALQKVDRGVGSRPRPGHRQRADLAALHPKRLSDRGAGGAQSRAVTVEQVEIEAVFAVVAVADRIKSLGQNGILVAELLAGA